MGTAEKKKPLEALCGLAAVLVGPVFIRVLRAAELSPCGNQWLTGVSSENSRPFAAAAPAWLQLKSVARRTRVRHLAHLTSEST